MERSLKSMMEDIRDRDTYTREEYEEVRERVEETPYVELWESKFEWPKMKKEVNDINKTVEESIFYKFFKGFVRFLLELL